MSRRELWREAVVTVALSLSIGAVLVLLWAFALVLWYPASQPIADPNHGCGPMIACLML